MGVRCCAGVRPSSSRWCSARGLDREDDLNVLGAPERSPAEDVVDIAGMYPIHATEMAFISSEGLKAFWQLDWDPYDPQRDPAV